MHVEEIGMPVTPQQSKGKITTLHLLPFYLGVIAKKHDGETTKEISIFEGR